MAHTVETYQFLLMEVMEHIIEIKKIDSELSIVEIIVDFSEKNKVDLSLIGDAIADDEYFKQVIEKDCDFHNQKTVDW